MSTESDSNMVVQQEMVPRDNQDAFLFSEPVGKLGGIYLHSVLEQCDGPCLRGSSYKLRVVRGNPFFQNRPLRPKDCSRALEDGPACGGGKGHGGQRVVQGARTDGRVVVCGLGLVDGLPPTRHPAKAQAGQSVRLGEAVGDDELPIRGI